MFFNNFGEGAEVTGNFLEVRTAGLRSWILPPLVSIRHGPHFRSTSCGLEAIAEIATASIETKSERKEFARRYAAERAHSAGDTQNRAKLDAMAPSDQHAETA